MTNKKYSGYDSFLKLAKAVQIGTFKKQTEIKNEKKRDERIALRFNNSLKKFELRTERSTKKKPTQ
jgi:hypothetical protein